MGTDADRAAVPERPATPPRPAVPPHPSSAPDKAPAASIPAPPPAPPHPAVPPRPSVPPRPVTSLFTTGPGVAGGTAGTGEKTGREPEAEPTPEDESSPQMPHSREREEEVAERSEGASVPAPRDPAHTFRPPVPALPSQPAPPTGEPLTASRRPAPPRAEPVAPPPPPSVVSTPSSGVAVRFRLASAAGPRGHAPLTARTVVVAVCLVLGVGLLGGAGTGVLLSGDAGERPAVAAGFDGARAAWHEIPVDELFPHTLKGEGAGPGGADRRWTRVAVAPDSGCKHAFDPLLTKALAPVGCARLVRATYADETSSSVTTVGLMFTKADPAAMRDLRERFAAQNLPQRTDLMPRPYAARGTVAADFGDAQRASWTVRVLRDAPVVVYTVSGFADGRVVTDPQSANDATRKGETSAAAQAGLGHDAQGIADLIERRLREATTQREPGSGDEAKDRDKKDQSRKDQDQEKKDQSKKDQGGEGEGKVG
ncbi:hypothetical protein ACTWQF_11740 [Streptomyces sp. 8N114]|uniref:hypothetical protein n=1 Tax=Streptomyces sp. 8N114 TaxID=3457419 RepID=UPI003FD28E5C